MTDATSDLKALGEQVFADDRAHVFHSWSAQGLISPLAVAGAEGSFFWDYDGNRYLDFSSQLVNTNIGHQHPKVVAAIQEQAAKLCTIAPSFANDARGEAARLIAELAPGDLNYVFFTNGGAEANENAVRMARIHTGRPKVLSAYRSYHGSTSAAIAMTGDPRRWANDNAGNSAGEHGALLRAVPVPLALPRLDRGRGDRARTEAPGAGHRLRGPGHDRGDRAGDHRRHRRRPGPAAGLPGRRARALRPLRHRLHRRRGHGRLRAARASGSRWTTGT